MERGLIPKSGWFSPRWRPEEARFSRENEGFPQWSFHPDSTPHLNTGCPILIVVNASRFKAMVYVSIAIAAFWDRTPAYVGFLFRYYPYPVNFDSGTVYTEL